MQIDNFPSQEIIDEFLQELSDLTELDLRWKQPNLVKFLVSFPNKQFFYINSLKESLLCSSDSWVRLCSGKKFIVYKSFYHS